MEIGRTYRELTEGIYGDPTTAYGALFNSRQRLPYRYNLAVYVHSNISTKLFEKLAFVRLYARWRLEVWHWHGAPSLQLKFTGDR